MAREYSVYEAKAKLSKLLREVRTTQKEVVITHHGQRVAKLVPIDRESEPTLDDRLSQFEANGQLLPATASPKTWERRTSKASAGALARFLESRK